MIADTLDTVSPSCENVQVAAVPGPAGLDDRPPTVAWSTPASAASFRGEAAQTLSVTATDDRGVAKVQFFDEDRLLCEDTAAPYTCAYQARGADVGRNTLIAVATDTAGQASTAIRLVTVQQVPADGAAAALAEPRPPRAVQVHGQRHADQRRRVLGHA